MENFKTYLKNNYFRKNFKLKVLVPIILLLIFIDIATKLWAKHNLINAGDKTFINWFINWNYILNSGSAKGMWADAPTKAITLAILTTIIIAIMFVFVNQTTLLIAFTFMIGGSLGNTIGRLFAHGDVIDFITWGTFMNAFSGSLRNYSFNLADMFVYTGLIFLVIAIIIYGIDAYKEYSIKKHSKEKFDQYKEVNEKLFEIQKQYENQKGYPLFFRKKISHKQYREKRKSIKKDYKDLNETKN